MKVFYTGVNLYGQFSTVPDDLIINKFTKVDIGEDIINYAMSLTYSVIGTSKYIIVRGFFNGRPYQNYKINDFDVDSIQQISCNECHILILDKNGEIWQLKALNDDKFRAITNFITRDSGNDFNLTDSITKIYCGKNMNLSITKLGYLFSIPSRLKVNNVVKDVACGQEHGILLTEEGQVFTWGVGTRGQLGHGDLENQPDPVPVTALNGIRIKKIAAGGWHCAVISEDGDVYGWGWNCNGQLGFCNDNFNTKNGTDENKTVSESVSFLFTPRPMDISSCTLDINAVYVACGMRHTLVFCDDGFLYGTGFNKYNQLGLRNNQENIYQMTRIMKIGEKNSDKINIKCGPYCSVFFLYD